MDEVWCIFRELVGLWVVGVDLMEGYCGSDLEVDSGL